MKGIFLLLGCCLALPIFADSDPVQWDQPLDGVYVPQGFDTDDSIEIVVKGTFQKPCLQLRMMGTELEEDEIWVHLIAYQYEGKNCQNLGMAFHQTIPLGMIRKSGTYSIIDRAGKRKIGALEVKEATDAGLGTDSQPYASLSDAFLKWDEGKPSLVLRGMHPTICSKLQEVKILPTKNTVVVLPILSAPIVGCPRLEKPFETILPIQETLPQTPFLLHVRSMGGQAINKIEHRYRS